MKNLRDERIGTIHTTNEGCKVKVVEYLNKRNVTVEFLDEEFDYTKTTDYDTILKGKISFPFKRSVYNVGYLGVGKYKTTSKVNSKFLIEKSYCMWHDMLKRCYGKDRNKKNRTYDFVTVCEEWHNFQNFARWFEENSYEIHGTVMCLDKDILFKSNDLYSPETCVIVPMEINMLFVKRDIARGESPIGVTSSKTKGKFNSRCNNHLKGTREYLGTFNSKDEAFMAYKLRKEEIIKECAEHYKDKIPASLYIAMQNYEVEETD